LVRLTLFDGENGGAMPEGIPISGKILVELRALRCMSQDDLSNACQVQGWPVPRALISDYERGKKSPTPQNLDAMRKALALTHAEMRALVCTPTLDAATSNGSPDEEDNADRRTAAKILAVGSFTALWVPSEALERISTHGDRPVDTKLIAAHEDVTDALADLHTVTRSDVLTPLVSAQADGAIRLLDRDVRAQVDRRRLEKTVVGSCSQAAKLAFADGDRLTARRYFALARGVAEDSGDPMLQAQALGSTSILYSSVPTGGRRGNPARAVNLLQGAAAHARRADDHTRAWVGWWLAAELAAARDARGFHRAVEAAEIANGQRGHTDGRGFFARRYPTGPELSSQNMGVGLVLIGRSAEAVDALNTSLTVVQSPRWHVIALTDIAAARVLQDEPEQACAELARALNLAVQAGYAMGIERIRGVRARFPAHWVGLSCAVNLDEQLSLV